MKNYYHKLGVLFLILVLLTGNKAFNQPINEERKKVIGAWVAEEGTWTFIFSADMRCSEYVDGKLETRYFYKITPANSVCGKQSEVDGKDATISFLQLNNVKTKEQICYIINGISNKTLSITGYMLPEPSVFKRKILNKMPPLKK